MIDQLIILLEESFWANSHIVSFLYDIGIDRLKALVTLWYVFLSVFASFIVIAIKFKRHNKKNRGDKKTLAEYMSYYNWNILLTVVLIFISIKIILFSELTILLLDIFIWDKLSNIGFLFLFKEKSWMLYGIYRYGTVGLLVLSVIWFLWNFIMYYFIYRWEKFEEWGGESNYRDSFKRFWFGFIFIFLLFFTEILFWIYAAIPD